MTRPKNTNADRAALALDALITYDHHSGETGEHQLRLIVADFLVSLAHLCDGRDIRLDSCLRLAAEQYHDQTSGDGTQRLVNYPDQGFYDGSLYIIFQPSDVCTAFEVDETDANLRRAAAVLEEHGDDHHFIDAMLYRWAENMRDALEALGVEQDYFTACSNRDAAGLDCLERNADLRCDGCISYAAELAEEGAAAE